MSGQRGLVLLCESTRTSPETHSLYGRFVEEAELEGDTYSKPRTIPLSVLSI